MPNDEHTSAFSSTVRIELSPDQLDALKSGAPKFKRSGRKLVRVRPAQQAPVVNGVVDAQSLQVLDSVYDAALLTELSGAIRHANERAQNFFLYDENELLRMNALDLISGVHEGLISEIVRVLQSGQYVILDAYGLRRDGSLFPVEIAANILIFDRMMLCLMIRDVSVRKESELRLLTVHNAIRQAFTGIGVTDQEGALIFTNPAMRRFWAGDDERSIEDVNFRTLWADPLKAEEVLYAVLVERKAWRGEIVARGFDGREWPAELSANANVDADDYLLGMVLSIEDVTARKAAEEALKIGERHRAMMASLGAACHHLGQPATVLTANLNLMARAAPAGNDDFAHALSEARKAAEELGDLLRKLQELDVFRETPYLQNAGEASAGRTILEIERPPRPG